MSKENNFLPIFRGWAIANFPFIEEDFDQMTLYEMICKITEYLNKMREQVNKNTESAEKYAEYLVEIREKVAELEADYEKFKADINTEIQTLFEQFTAQITSELNNQLAVLRYYIDTQYSELNKKIDDVIAGDIKVYDPTTGLLSPIQVVINNIFDMNRTDAITASEFDLLELTATGFDEKEITAFNFDVNGKSLLTS